MKSAVIFHGCAKVRAAPVIFVTNPMQRSSQAYTFSQFCEKVRRYCAYQERCHKEVRQKLIELGADAQMSGQVIAQMVEENYLNEERFARAFAGGKFRQKHWGRIKIIRELQFRGVSPYCIRAGLTEIPDEDYIHILKSELGKLQGKKSMKHITDQYKVAKSLISRGFEADLVWAELKMPH